MNKNIKLAVAGAVLALSATANAGIIIPAGDWTVDLGGNVNAFVSNVDTETTSSTGVKTKAADTNTIGTGLLPSALGIGAKGLDTPAEREFLRQVMTGTISMDKNALIKMTQIRRDIEKRSIDRYNSAVDSGELNDYFASTKRQKKLIEIPDNSGFRIVP